MSKQECIDNGISTSGGSKRNFLNPLRAWVSNILSRIKNWGINKSHWRENKMKKEFDDLSWMITEKFGLLKHDSNTIILKCWDYTLHLTGTRISLKQEFETEVKQESATEVKYKSEKKWYIEYKMYIDDEWKFILTEQYNLKTNPDNNSTEWSWELTIKRFRDLILDFINMENVEIVKWKFKDGIGDLD